MGQLYNEYDENPVRKTLKQRKKKKLRKKFKVILIGLILLIVVIFLLTPYSKVKSISIKGNDITSQEDIKSHISVNELSYYFLINKNKVKEEIEDLPTIKSANITVDMVGNIDIVVEEALPIAYAEINDVIYEINDIGRIVEIKDQERIQLLKSLPFVQKMTSIDLLTEFAQQFKEVPSLMQNEMSDIILEPKSADPTRLKCIMKDGKIVYIRIEDVAKRLNDEEFNYEAYKTTLKETCIFSIEGKNIYYIPCE